MRFAKWTYLLAGISGLLFVLPSYFTEDSLVDLNPPKVEHPEYYYGMLGVIVVWQFAYMLVGTDPVRYRPLMLLCALAKGGFVGTIVTLYLLGRVRPIWLGIVSFDAVWTVIFVIAYFRIGRAGALYGREAIPQRGAVGVP